MGTHLRVLSESYPMDTNMTGFRWFPNILRSCALDDSIVSALEGLKEKYTPLISRFPADLVSGHHMF